jgi:hypothetical protein
MRRERVNLNQFHNEVEETRYCRRPFRAGLGCDLEVVNLGWKYLRLKVQL